MPNTYTKIASIAVGSGGSSNMTFSSIPSTYTDLMLLISARTTLSSYGDGLILTINGTTSAIVATKTLQGASGSIASFNSPSTSDVYVGDTNAATSTASAFGNTSVYIPNYAVSVGKTFSADHVAENNGSWCADQITGGLWNNTNAITTIKIGTGLGGSSSFVQYSTATLYGISKS